MPINNDPNPVYRKPPEQPKQRKEDIDLKPMLRGSDDVNGNIRAYPLQDHPPIAIPNTSVQTRFKDNSRRTLTHGHDNKTAKQTHKTGSGIILSHHQKVLKRARIG